MDTKKMTSQVRLRHWAGILLNHVASSYIKLVGSQRPSAPASSATPAFCRHSALHAWGFHFVPKMRSSGILGPVVGEAAYARGAHRLPK
jgi:hypothetical protein